MAELLTSDDVVLLINQPVGRYCQSDGAEIFLSG